VPNKTLINLYHSLFESTISYGIVLWNRARTTHLHPLVVTQKHIIRNVLRKNRRTPSFPLFLQLHLLPLRHLFIYKALPLFYQRCGQRPLPPRITRKGSRYEVPRPTMAFCTRSHLYVAPKISNCIPDYISELSRNRQKGPEELAFEQRDYLFIYKKVINHQNSWIFYF